MKSTMAGLSGKSMVVAMTAIAGLMLAGCGEALPEDLAADPTAIQSEPPQIAGSEMGLPDQLVQPLGDSVHAMAAGDSCNCCAGWNPACVIFSGNVNPNSAYTGNIQYVNGRWACVCNTAPWNLRCTTSCF